MDTNQIKNMMTYVENLNIPMDKKNQLMNTFAFQLNIQNLVDHIDDCNKKGVRSDLTRTKTSNQND